MLLCLSHYIGIIFAMDSHLKLIIEIIVGSTDIIVESSGDLNWRLNKKEKKSKRKKLKKNSKIRHAKTNNKGFHENKC